MKVKKLNDLAVFPTKAHESDAGYDIVAISDPEFSDTYVEYKTGLSIDIDNGHHIEIFPRGSISKYDLVLANSIGLVDQGYRGEFIVRFKMIIPIGDKPWIPNIYKKGDKIAQLVIRKTENTTFEWSDEISNTDRNSGAFGSTGT